MYQTRCYITRDDEDIELDVYYSMSRYYPARLGGPPEYCYPAEGGEIEELTAYLDGKPFALTPDDARSVERQVYDNHDYDA
jgi:hypothetical protein